jgi:hypothetical protein
MRTTAGPVPQRASPRRGTPQKTAKNSGTACGTARFDVMPRFYFHVFDDEETFDEEGSELPDADAACEYAKENARALVCESVKKGHLNLDHRIEIEDETGRRTTLTFRDAFTIEG